MALALNKQEPNQFKFTRITFLAKKEKLWPKFVGEILCICRVMWKNLKKCPELGDVTLGLPLEGKNGEKSEEALPAHLQLDSFLTPSLAGELQQKDFWFYAKKKRLNFLWKKFFKVP